MLVCISWCLASQVTSHFSSQTWECAPLLLCRTNSSWIVRSETTEFVVYSPKKRKSDMVIRSCGSLTVGMNRHSSPCDNDTSLHRANRLQVHTLCAEQFRCHWLVLRSMCQPVGALIGSKWLQFR